MVCVDRMSVLLHTGQELNLRQRVPEVSAFMLAADAQDVYQESLLAAFRGLPRFRMDSNFSTWLYRIAVNRAIKLRRRPHRQREVSVADVPERSGGTGTGPDQVVLEAELEAELDRALDELSRQERAAFVLCHRQGLRIDQAAEAMDCSSGSVKSYLFRGRDKVRRYLVEYLER